MGNELDIRKRIVYLLLLILSIVCSNCNFYIPDSSIPCAVVIIKGGRGTVPCLFNLYSSNQFEIIAGNFKIGVDNNPIQSQELRLEKNIYRHNKKISKSDKEEIDDILLEIKNKGVSAEEYNVHIDDGSIVYCYMDDTVYCASYDEAIYAPNPEVRKMAQKLVEISPRSVKKYCKTNIRLGDGWFWDKFWYMI